MRQSNTSVCLATNKSKLDEPTIYNRSQMSNKEEKVYVEQASQVYRKMALLELLSEENLLQRYKQKYRESITNELHLVLEQEIARKLI